MRLASEQVQSLAAGAADVTDSTVAAATSPDGTSAATDPAVTPATDSLPDLDVVDAETSAALSSRWWLQDDRALAAPR